MLGELERRLVTAGVRRIVCLLAANSETGPLALEHSGFSARREMVLYERVVRAGAVRLACATARFNGRAGGCGSLA